MTKAEMFKVYYHVVESASDKYRVYYAYDSKPEEAVKRIEKMLESELYVYDIFPNYEREVKSLEDSIAVITKSQQEMFLPTGLEMEFIGCTTILYGDKDEDNA